MNCKKWQIVTELGYDKYFKYIKAALAKRVKIMSHKHPTGEVFLCVMGIVISSK